MESFILQSIQVRTLSSEKRWSLHQDLAQDLEPDFIESVKLFGIIHPPLVQEQENGVFEVICGVKRLRASIDILQQTAIDCLVLEPSLPASDVLLLVIEEQKLSGSLSPIEKARAGLLCLQILENDKARQIASTVLGSKGHLERLGKLLDLEQPILKAIHAGRISEQTGRELLSLSITDRLLLQRLFERFTLNHNKQRRIIDMGRIINARNKCTFIELFSTWYPEYINDEPMANLPQATNHLLQDLGKRSSPMLTESENQFKNQLAALGLPPSCSLSHSKAFEQDKITLNVTFANVEEFVVKWSEIKNYLK